MLFLRYSVAVVVAPDGAGPQTVQAAQELVILDTATGVPGVASGSAPILIAGGNSPTAANLNTAAVAMGTLVSSQLQANLAQIQGFATGGD